MELEAIAPYLQDFAKDHEDWQVQQAKEAVRLYRYFKGIPEAIRGDTPNLMSRLFGKFRREYRPGTPTPPSLVPDGEDLPLLMLKCFGAYEGFKEPKSVNQLDLERFLSHLVIDRRGAATTQRLVFNALIFLFRHGLAKEISGLDGAVRACIPRRFLPVLSRPEVFEILEHMEGAVRFMAGIIYG